MEIGVLPSEGPGVFRTLLLPEAAQALERGEPLTALGLTEGGLAVGAAAGYLAGKRFCLISLYVAPAFRRKGGGRMLVEELARLCRGRADTMSVDFTATRPDHETLSPFLERMGFMREEDLGEAIYLIPLGQAARSAFFAGRGVERGTPFSRLSRDVLSAGERAALASGAPIPPGGLSSPLVDRDVSVAFVQDEVIQAYVACDTGWEGGITLSAVWSQSRDAMVLPGLLRSALFRAAEKYPKDTALVLQTVNQRSAALALSLLPEARPISHSYLLHFDY